MTYKTPGIILMTQLFSLGLPWTQTYPIGLKYPCFDKKKTCEILENETKNFNTKIIRLWISHKISCL